jgi:hypothetical protein
MPQLQKIEYENYLEICDLAWNRAAKILQRLCIVFQVQQQAKTRQNRMKLTAEE